MPNNRRFVITLLIAASCLLSIAGADAQTKRRKPLLQSTPEAGPTPKPESGGTKVPVQTPRGKKNERPPSGDTDGANVVASNATGAVKPVYFYEFTHPYYLIRKLRIEHDESGKGTISFMKGGYTEPITDPLDISPAAMERLRTAFTALDFLNSRESYQYEKDMSHLGVMKLTMRKDGRERTSQFNWTDNKDAKAITDEYRKLGNQYIWMFDINLARENQPLQAPGLMDELDSLIRRKDVSDAEQMLPFLRRLTEDERVPLIARNHASKLIAQIEKAKK